MNKRAFIGMVFLIIAGLLALIVFGLIYQIKTNGLQITTGKIVVDINYDKEEAQNNTSPRITEFNETANNKTRVNSTSNSTILIQNLSE